MGHVEEVAVISYVGCKFLYSGDFVDIEVEGCFRGGELLLKTVEALVEVVEGK